jgi:hypothetical protein
VFKVNSTACRAIRGLSRTHHALIASKTPIEVEPPEIFTLEPDFIVPETFSVAWIPAKITQVPYRLLASFDP